MIELRRRSDTLNILGDIDPIHQRAFDDLKAVVATFTERNDKSSADPFWARGGEDAALMASAFVVAHLPQMKNFQAVRDILSSAPRFQKAAEAAGNSTAYHGMLARLAGSFNGMNQKELLSFLSVSNRGMGVLDTPAIARNTQASTFSPSELFTHPKGVTAYLILPPEFLKSHGAILRLWVLSFFRSCIQNGVQERQLVRFVLDEAAAALGRMPELEDAIMAYRGYGVRLTFILQNLAGVSRIMSEGQESLLLGNCTTIYFGISDYKTASEVSESLGKYTQRVAGGNDGWSRTNPSGGDSKGGGSYGVSGGTSWQLAPRELATAGELMTADPTVAITLIPGKPPVLTRLVRYFDADFRKPGSLGPLRCAVDTACLLLSSLVVFAISLGLFLMEGRDGRRQETPARPLARQDAGRRVEGADGPPAADGGPGIGKGPSAQPRSVRTLRAERPGREP